MSEKLAPATSEDFLPVGMLASGRGPAKAMESVAKRNINVEGWEPFHYEQISATEYEVTGGIPAMIGGAKKWPEPHTTVIVLEQELTQELQANAVTDMPSVGEIAPVISDAVQTAVLVPTFSASANSHTRPQFMTVILRMPDDEAGHRRLAEMLALNKNFFGADVVSTAFQNDIMVSASLQKTILK
ncbi:hypothetical protein [Glaciimonas immobilis]|uniref:Uncharacterized protein n=1 Tax=Glaciimonas immobilis TaxID=728004 RepID=A0A840RPI0_9BURK|nr:hypothetical protein [Glaciimonas immobilis]KAF3999512.1 hypothetical protein HAV38_06250 [Glaciimonas immobilis]MBB5199042.1 hypothetical protein [Glaciimonas immobilis]